VVCSARVVVREGHLIRGTDLEDKVVAALFEHEIGVGGAAAEGQNIVLSSAGGYRVLAVAFVEDDEISARAGGQSIVAGAADEQVVVGGTGEGIGASTSVEKRVSTTIGKRIVTVAALENIYAVTCNLSLMAVPSATAIGNRNELIQGNLPEAFALFEKRSAVTYAHPDSDASE
jgi:hypothetical protein